MTKNKMFSLLCPFFCHCISIFLKGHINLIILVLTGSMHNGLVAKSTMLIKQRRGTGVHSFLDHIHPSDATVPYCHGTLVTSPPKLSQ